MRKHAGDILSPGELYDEVRTAVAQLGELAVALGGSLPAVMEDLESMSEQEIIDLWTVSGASTKRVDRAWDQLAARLIVQYLETASVLPAESEPSS